MRERAETAVAADDGGDTLKEFFTVERISPELHVVVGVCVHESRGHYQPSRIKVSFRCAHLADHEEPTALDPHVGNPRSATGAIDDQAITDRQIDHANDTKLRAVTQSLRSCIYYTTLGPASRSS
jgi:hypothetical protein